MLVQYDGASFVRQYFLKPSVWSFFIVETLAGFRSLTFHCSWWQEATLFFSVGEQLRSSVRAYTHIHSLLHTVFQL